jgi:hypothetical protein
MSRKKRGGQSMQVPEMAPGDEFPELELPWWPVEPPLEGRIRRLAAETPTTDLVFDLLADAAGGHPGEPLTAALAAFTHKAG